jgi:hypothetical protein
MPGEEGERQRRWGDAVDAGGPEGQAHQGVDLRGGPGQGVGVADVVLGLDGDGAGAVGTPVGVEVGVRRPPGVHQLPGAAVAADDEVALKWLSSGVPGRDQ